jgi:hypothetical protein
MMRLSKKAVCWFAVGLVAFVALRPAFADSDGHASSMGQTYALIVGGVSKDPGHRLARDRTIEALHAYLCGAAGLEPQRVTVLCEGDPGLSNRNGAATAENVKAAIDSVAGVIRPRDRLLFWYLGLANAVSDTLRFNLPGPDATHEDLARWLGKIKAETQAIVLDCPCAALAAKALARQGRIVLCASTVTQAYSTNLTARFVPALTQMGNDVNADGRVSVLEAFTATARETEQWYRRIECLATETPCLEDNGDGVPSERPWRYEADGGDGARASAFFFQQDDSR